MVSPLTEAELEKIELVLSALTEIAQTGRLTNQEHVQGQLESFLQMPSSDESTKSMFSHPYILWNYAKETVNRLSRDSDENRMSLLKRIIDLEPKENNHVRLRKFQPKRVYYYGLPFQSDDTLYSFWEYEPVLLTKISQEWLTEEKWETELGWIVRPEVRVLSALSFSVESGLCWFQLSDKVADLPASLVLGDESTLSETSLKRAQLAVGILTRMEMQDFEGFKSAFSEVSPFKFRMEGLSPEKTRKFYERFDINDDLTLRVGFFLLKSVMLWNSEGRVFGEDACENLFFGLEGCLRLIHRRFSGAKNFELNPTLQHIKNTFATKSGYSWMLRDAYEKRTLIVHPEPRIESGWLPSLIADDFYENYDMAIDLFYYAVAGELLPRE